ncbi:MAG: hypothetical protein H0W87_06085 [Actinobacteria bacterium]|nr:hypothetical protein [Actinomycetota bacterium]
MVGDILNAAFELYKRHWKHLMSVALAFYLIAGTITLGLTIAFGRWGALGGAIVLLIGIFWLTGALVEAVADIRDGRVEMPWNETFSRVWPRVWPLLGASILAGLGIAVGLALLIVPGLILLTWWALLAPAVVLEKRDVFDSFRRSRELVRGNAWSVFGVLIITYLLTSVVSGVIRAIFTPLPDYLGQYIADVIGGTVVAPFSALAITLMYFRLAGPETTPESVPEALPPPEPR